MILQSLYNYYQILVDDPDVEIALPGYSATNVSFAINLSSKGELLDLIPLPSKVFDGRKTRDVSYSRRTVPEQVKRSGTSPKPNFMCDHSAFVLGIPEQKGKDKQYGSKRFEAFRQHNVKVLSKASSPVAQAVLAFLQNHDPQKVSEHPIIASHLEALLEGGNLIFQVQSKNALDDPEIKRAWEDHKLGQEAIKMQCLVTGEIEPIARLHPNIQGVPGAKSTGASLISFDDPSFQSYNRKDKDTKGLNSPVSRRVASGYGVVLNYLLSNQNPNRKIHLGDTTMVYWAETTNKRYAGAFYAFLNPEFQQEEESEETKGKRKRAKDTEKKMGEVAESVRQGKAIDIAALREGLEDSTRFYVLGLAPSAARLAVRFFLTEPFGVFAERIMLHYKDLKIEKEYPNQPTYLSPYRILAECVSPKITRVDSREKELKSSWSLLGGALMRAILTGAPYPEGLYAAIINRIRHDTDEEKRSVKINYVRAAYIKAHLLRKFRRQAQNPYQEALQMSLNESYTLPAYVLGRLFAWLEKAQREALGQNINATIKDRYFTSACASPASVFPTLLRLSHHHIQKAEYGKNLDRNIQAMLDMLEAKPFPSHLSLDDQGVFVLGYYHQRAAFYAKKVNNADEAISFDNSES
ncbi:MAG: type I-C CRISPR-associated protein Cas8c/Csd1 [Anaerolineales bacterium]